MALARAAVDMIEERGLRAQLETGSLLTGELFVGFEYFLDAPKAKILTGVPQDPLEIPVAPGGIATLEAKLTSILTKVDNMPLKGIGADTQKLVASLNQTLKDADASSGQGRGRAVGAGAYENHSSNLHRAIADADRSLLGPDAAARPGLMSTRYPAGSDRCGSFHPRLYRLSRTRHHRKR